MQKLHLVGVTTDRDGLILSVRRGARSGSYLLPVDDDLMAAVDEHRQHQAEQEEAPEEDAAASPRPESTLPVREIQARLRRGRSVAEVAKAAGVDESWVERFAPPVLAERARVIAAARGLSLDRPRLGPSVVPLGEAVARHLADRGVSMTPEEQAEQWTAHLLDGGRWTVRFAFRYRGKERVLAYELDEPAGSLAALDRTSSQMGYVAPSAPPVGSRSAAPGRERSEPSRPSRERERATAAMRKVATRQAADAERAVARRAKERAKLAASQPTPDAPEPAAAPAPTGTPKKAKASAKTAATSTKTSKAPAPKATRSAKPSKAPAKKATGLADKAAKAAKTSTGSADKAAKAAKKAAGPAKKATGPAKKATGPAKKTAKPAKKATGPAKKAAPASKPAEKTADPAKKATAPAGKSAGATPETPRIAPDLAAPTGQVGSAPSSEAGDTERGIDEPAVLPRQDPARRVIPPRTPLERARARDGEPAAPPRGTEGAPEPAPRFRFNLVEPADTAPRPAGPEDRDDGAPRPSVDPARPARRPMGRPPRTRPLRAT